MDMPSKRMLSPLGHPLFATDGLGGESGGGGGNSNNRSRDASRPMSMSSLHASPYRMLSGSFAEYRSWSVGERKENVCNAILSSEECVQPEGSVKSKQTPPHVVSRPRKVGVISTSSSSMQSDFKWSDQQSSLAADGSPSRHLLDEGSRRHSSQEDTDNNTFSRHTTRENVSSLSLVPKGARRARYMANGRSVSVDSRRSLRSPTDDVQHVSGSQSQDQRLGFSSIEIGTQGKTTTTTTTTTSNNNSCSAKSGRSKTPKRDFSFQSLNRSFDRTGNGTYSEQDSDIPTAQSPQRSGSTKRSASAIPQRLRRSVEKLFGFRTSSKGRDAQKPSAGAGATSSGDTELSNTEVATPMAHSGRRGMSVSSLTSLNVLRSEANNTNSSSGTTHLLTEGGSVILEKRSNNAMRSGDSSPMSTQAIPHEIQSKRFNSSGRLSTTNLGDASVRVPSTLLRSPNKDVQTSSTKPASGIHVKCPPPAQQSRRLVVHPQPPTTTKPVDRLEAAAVAPATRLTPMMGSRNGGASRSSMGVSSSSVTATRDASGTSSTASVSRNHTPSPAEAAANGKVAPHLRRVRRRVRRDRSLKATTPPLPGFISSVSPTEGSQQSSSATPSPIRHCSRSASSTMCADKCTASPDNCSSFTGTNTSVSDSAARTRCFHGSQPQYDADTVTVGASIDDCMEDGSAGRVQRVNGTFRLEDVLEPHSRRVLLNQHQLQARAGNIAPELSSRWLVQSGSDLSSGFNSSEPSITSVKPTEQTLWLNRLSSNHDTTSSGSYSRGNSTSRSETVTYRSAFSKEQQQRSDRGSKSEAKRGTKNTPSPLKPDTYLGVSSCTLLPDTVKLDEGLPPPSKSATVRSSIVSSRDSGTNTWRMNINHGHEQRVHAQPLTIGKGAAGGFLLENLSETQLHNAVGATKKSSEALSGLPQFPPFALENTRTSEPPRAPPHAVQLQGPLEGWSVPVENSAIFNVFTGATMLSEDQTFFCNNTTTYTGSSIFNGSEDFYDDPPMSGIPYDEDLVYSPVRVRHFGHSNFSSSASSQSRTSDSTPSSRATSRDRVDGSIERLSRSDFRRAPFGVVVASQQGPQQWNLEQSGNNSNSTALPQARITPQPPATAKLSGSPRATVPGVIVGPVRTGDGHGGQQCGTDSARGTQAPGVAPAVGAMDAEADTQSSGTHRIPAVYPLPTTAITAQNGFGTQGTFHTKANLSKGRRVHATSNSHRIKRSSSSSTEELKQKPAGGKALLSSGEEGTHSGYESRSGGSTSGLTKDTEAASEDVQSSHTSNRIGIIHQPSSSSHEKKQSTFPLRAVVPSLQRENFSDGLAPVQVYTALQSVGQDVKNLETSEMVEKMQSSSSREDSSALKKLAPKRSSDLRRSTQTVRFRSELDDAQSARSSGTKQSQLGANHSPVRQFESAPLGGRNDDDSTTHSHPPSGNAYGQVDINRRIGPSDVSQQACSQERYAKLREAALGKIIPSPLAVAPRSRTGVASEGEHARQPPTLVLNSMTTLSSSFGNTPPITAIPSNGRYRLLEDANGSCGTDSLSPEKSSMSPQDMSYRPCGAEILASPAGALARKIVKVPPIKESPNSNIDRKGSGRSATPRSPSVQEMYCDFSTHFSTRRRQSSSSALDRSLCSPSSTEAAPGARTTSSDVQRLPIVHSSKSKPTHDVDAQHDASPTRTKIGSLSGEKTSASTTSNKSKEVSAPSKVPATQSEEAVKRKAVKTAESEVHMRSFSGVMETPGSCELSYNSLSYMYPTDFESALLHMQNRETSGANEKNVVTNVAQRDSIHPPATTAEFQTPQLNKESAKLSWVPSYCGGYDVNCGLDEGFCYTSALACNAAESKTTAKSPGAGGTLSLATMETSFGTVHTQKPRTTMLTIPPHECFLDNDGFSEGEGDNESEEDGMRSVAMQNLPRPQMPHTTRAPRIRTTAVSDKTRMIQPRPTSFGSNGFRSSKIWTWEKNNSAPEILPSAQQPSVRPPS